MAKSRIAVVTVHGTNDLAPEGKLDGAKWFQRGSAFAERLIPRLAQQGVEAEIVPHLWSGANSAQGREEGARALAKRVRDLQDQYAGVHIIGHSHGGNVANEAATMIGWRLRKRRKPLISSISTVGTPFFRQRIGGSTFIAGFLILSWLSLFALLLMGGASLLLSTQLHVDPAAYARDYIAIQEAAGVTYTEAEKEAYVAKQIADARSLQWVQYVPPVLLLLSLFVLPIATRQGVRSFRIQRRQNPDAKIFSIWHPNDEAISFLKRVEQLEIKPFGAGSLWRSSGTSGISIGIPLTLMLCVALPLVVALLFALGVEINNGHWAMLSLRTGLNFGFLFNGLNTTELLIAAIIAALLAPPILFALIYFLTRLVHGGVGEVFGRRTLNGVVGGALRGMAFGKDGDVKLDCVATHSHTYGIRPMELTGDVEGRMRSAAGAAASALIDRYRWTLFAADPDKDALAKLSEDAQTWKSLIHTTYFDQPEVVDALADYIAESVGRERAER